MTEPQYALPTGKPIEHKLPARRPFTINRKKEPGQCSFTEFCPTGNEFDGDIRFLIMDVLKRADGITAQDIWGVIKRTGNQDVVRDLPKKVPQWFITDLHHLGLTDVIAYRGGRYYLNSGVTE